MCVCVCVQREREGEGGRGERERMPSRERLCRRYVHKDMEEAEEEEEEGLFKADAVNEEDPERDRATQV